MLKKVDDSIIELLKSSLNELNIESEIKENDIDKIFEYFENKEIELSTKQSNAEEIDVEEFDKICLAVDDFFIEADSKDSIDLKDLNNRLGFNNYTN